MKALTAGQVESWRDDGFLSPFPVFWPVFWPVLSPGETAACRAGLQRFETFIGSPVPRGARCTARRR